VKSKRGIGRVDLCLINPGNNRLIYQELALKYAAIQPPVWAGLLANWARAAGYVPAIIDQEAEGLDADQVAERTVGMKPRLVALVVYGQQPSASTQNMTMAGEIASKLKARAPALRIVMIGGHPSALPARSLEESECDYVCQGEGPATLAGLLAGDDKVHSNGLDKVPGLWYRHEGQSVFTFPAEIIPQKDLPTVLPGVAWDLLPMQAYRAHNWHCFDSLEERAPYAAVYTSLGCPFRCSFCCINAPFTKPTIRFWDPGFMITELDTLAVKYRIKNIKIVDEMFVLNERHVLSLCDAIIERGYDFNIWAYARVDTVKDGLLEKMKRAGINWLCLGIESGSKHVRDGVEKGRFKEDDVYKTVKRIRDAGIYVIANFIFGLPDDDYASMQATLDMAVELNCEFANFYSAMAYPGSRLYDLAIEKGWKLPKEWHDFSQHSVEQLPLPSEKLAAGEILNFRDKAWQIYFTNPEYLKLLRRTYGQGVVDHIRRMATFELKRKYARPLKKEPILRTDFQREAVFAK